jgi:hypothetical protein
MWKMNVYLIRAGCYNEKDYLHQYLEIQPSSRLNSTIGCPVCENGYL